MIVRDENLFLSCFFILSQHRVLKRSLSCLRESISDLNNTYTTALLAYVFTLAGDMETRAHLLQHLDTVAIRQGESCSWNKSLLPHYCCGSLPCACVWMDVCRRSPPLVSDSNRNVSLSVCGDQLLRAAGQTQCFSYSWRPGLRRPHRQMAHRAAEPIWRLLIYTGTAQTAGAEAKQLHSRQFYCHCFLINRQMLFAPGKEKLMRLLRC